MQLKAWKTQAEGDKSGRIRDAADELFSMLKEIYDLTDGPYSDPVIGEDLYNRMEKIIQRLI